MTLRLTADLEDANVGYACGFGYAAQAFALADSLADSLAPFLLSSGTPRGCAAHASEGVHLEAGEGAEHPHVGSDDEGGAEAGVAVRPRLSEGFSGVGCEPFPLRLGHAVEVLSSGHGGNLAYRGGLVKRDFLACSCGSVGVKGEA